MPTTNDSQGFTFYIHTGVGISYRMLETTDAHSEPLGYGWDVSAMWDNVWEDAGDDVQFVSGFISTESDGLDSGDDHESALLDALLAARNAIRTLGLKPDPWDDVPGSGRGFLYGASDEHNAGWWGEDFPGGGNLTEVEAKAIIERVCSARGWEHHDLSKVE